MATLSLALCSLSLALPLHAETSPGDDSSSSTTRDSTGIVTAVAPGQTITVDSRRGPFTYRLGRDMHLYGINAKPTTITEIHKGQKVTVYYHRRDGEETVARLVILADKGAKTH